MLTLLGSFCLGLRVGGLAEILEYHTGTIVDFTRFHSGNAENPGETLLIGQRVRYLYDLKHGTPPKNLR